MVEQVGRYKIERELGRGGMGVVYLADDPMLGRKVAIKTIHIEITDPTQREYLRTQLLRDARASAGLSHPNVVNVHDVIEAGDTTYLVMEYISGETLSARMQRAPAPDTAWLLRVLRDIAAALDYTHRKGVVHRDVKPGNIMIDGSARVRIMDFGLARSTAQRTGTAGGLVAGTIQYMSPEQIRGDALDGRSDQFSLAAVAYEMLTGKPLFEARSPVTLAQKILNETPELAHVQNPLLPEATSAVLAKALDHNPSGRYPTCTAFVDALIATFDGATVQALLTPPEEQPTVALTGMIDVGIPNSPKAATAPVQGPGRWSGHAPLLIAVGLVVSTIAITAVTLINGRNHGEAPARPNLAPYGPPPLFGKGPEKSGKRPGKKPFPAPPPPPVSQHPPLLDALAHTPPPELHDSKGSDSTRKAKREARRQEIPDVPFFPDFAKDMRGPEPKVLQDGRMELTARNFGIAVDLFTAAIKIAPDDYHAYYYRGMAYLGAGNPKLAQADYTKVIQLRPDDAQGWYQLAIALENQHRMKEALENYARAATLKPDMADAFYASAMIYDEQLMPQKALAELDKAIEANPKYIKGYQARAELKKRLGDPTAKDDTQTAKDLAAQRKAPPPPKQ
jgi:serine/threonine protein kinase/Tfp pilus assembly protein PilF